MIKVIDTISKKKKEKKTGNNYDLLDIKKDSYTPNSSQLGKVKKTNKKIQ